MFTSFGISLSRHWLVYQDSIPFISSYYKVEDVSTRFNWCLFVIHLQAVVECNMIFRHKNNTLPFLFIFCACFLFCSLGKQIAGDVLTELRYLLLHDTDHYYDLTRKDLKLPTVSILRLSAALRKLK